jgi:hypothetical protein
MSHGIETKLVENRRGERRGDLVSERKRISGLFDLIKALRAQTAVGREIPLQFQDNIFMWL